ncbi:MAG: hypothetical protein QOG54_503 [Actinomycetota bacterium]|jgi:hypothetical protein|nr:hypothetical protein [Actinomycetota bacterium]
MKIDCTECEMYRTEHCDDCLVTALLHPMGDEVDIGEDLALPIRALSGAGLIPTLKFRPRLSEPVAERSSSADEGQAEAG